MVQYCRLARWFRYPCGCFCLSYHRNILFLTISFELHEEGNHFLPLLPSDYPPSSVYVAYTSANGGAAPLSYTGGGPSGPVVGVSQMVNSNGVGGNSTGGLPLPGGSQLCPSQTMPGHHHIGGGGGGNNAGGGGMVSMNRPPALQQHSLYLQQQQQQHQQQRLINPSSSMTSFTGQQYTPTAAAAPVRPGQFGGGGQPPNNSRRSNVCLSPQINKDSADLGCLSALHHHHHPTLPPQQHMTNVPSLVVGSSASLTCGSPPSTTSFPGAGAGGGKGMLPGLRPPATMPAGAAMFNHMNVSGQCNLSNLVGSPIPSNHPHPPPPGAGVVTSPTGILVGTTPQTLGGPTAMMGNPGSAPGMDNPTKVSTLCVWPHNEPFYNAQTAIKLRLHCSALT